MSVRPRSAVRRLPASSQAGAGETSRSAAPTAATTRKKPRAVADLESTLIRTVRARGSISRVELARSLKLVASTAGIYVDRLIRRGYLRESAPPRRGLGRPPVLLELNPAGGRFIGVDFDARQVMVSAVDFAQQPIVRRQKAIPPRAAAERVLAMIEKMIEEMIGVPAGGGSQPLLGIGLGVPGPVDRRQGVSLRYDFIKGWRNIAIGPRIAERFQTPVFVENNLRSIAIGELWLGQGRGRRDLVCLGIRSGIGSGIIIDGKLLHGANNLAGEIGGWIVPDFVGSRDAANAAGGEATTCAAGGEAAGGLTMIDSMGDSALGESALGESARPTIESLASLTALVADAARRLNAGRSSALGRPGDTPSVAELLAAADAGDSLAGSLVGQAARVHGWVAHQLTLLVDPELIIVAGPLVESAFYLKCLRRSVIEFGGAEFGLRVAPSNLGDFAGALGAAALAFHHWTLPH